MPDRRLDPPLDGKLMMDLKLNGRTVFLTGGSGGIGRQIARQFSQEGAQVAVHFFTNRDSADSVVTEIGTDCAMAVGGDAADENQMSEAFRMVRERFGRIDVLVACAGLWPVNETPIHQMEIAQWRNTLDNNLTSAFVCCREFLTGVTADSFDDPSIVLIGSTAGLFGEAGHGDYAAAKSGLTFGLMLSLKNEIIRIARNGRVNTVCPGWTVSPMTDRFTGNEDAVRRALSTIALRKVASPRDIANAVLFLSSSSAAGHITGQVLTVSGGMEGRKLHEESGEWRVES